jgi:hypothetical protein
MKWVYKPGHPKANESGFVSMADYQAEPVEYALHANIMVDRFYEGTKGPEGEDLGSRRKHRAFMREKGLTTMDDYKQTWAKSEQERRELREQNRLPSKTRREVLERAWWQKFQR